MAASFPGELCGIQVAVAPSLGGENILGNRPCGVVYFPSMQAPSAAVSTVERQQGILRVH